MEEEVRIRFGYCRNDVTLLISLVFSCTKVEL